jgi:hypothetical protein
MDSFYLNVAYAYLGYLAGFYGTKALIRWWQNKKIDFF